MLDWNSFFLCLSWYLRQISIHFRLSSPETSPVSVQYSISSSGQRSVQQRCGWTGRKTLFSSVSINVQWISPYFKQKDRSVSSLNYHLVCDLAAYVREYSCFNEFPQRYHEYMLAYLLNVTGVIAPSGWTIPRGLVIWSRKSSCLLNFEQ